MELLMKYFENEKTEKIERYRILNSYIKKGQILFVGSSLMEQFPIYEFIQDYDIEETIYNRGVGGFTIVEMLQHMDTMVFDLEPTKIFVNIGTNDLNAEDYSKEDLLKHYDIMLKQILERLPQTIIYIIAYYPVNGDYDFGNEYMKQVLKIRTNARIIEMNEALEQLAQKYRIRYIDINNRLYDDKGNLKHEYSIEGMHMYANGYNSIFGDLIKYVREY